MDNISRSMKHEKVFLFVFTSEIDHCKGVPSERTQSRFFCAGAGLVIVKRDGRLDRLRQIAAAAAAALVLFQHMNTGQ